MSGQRPPPSETEFPKDFFKVPTMNKLPGQSALLDDAAERRKARIEELAIFAYNHVQLRGSAPIDVIRIAMEEATEAAALKCEKRANARMHERGIYDDTTGAWEASEEVQALCIEDDDCAAAIRGQK